MIEKTDIIIIGASASGLMCAIEAAKRQRKVIVLDHANKAGKKILISGGGRCNFTNTSVSADNYLSHNPHFCKSALSRYTQWDFIARIERHGIPYHERTLGQLFCVNSAKDILTMLLSECEQLGVTIKLDTNILEVSKKTDESYHISTHQSDYHAQSLVIATGGLSFPKMGASPFGYHIAEQFGIKVWPTRAGLVPLTLQPDEKERLAECPGISADSLATHNQHSFRENSLFTHRGLSGPAILQISSYWTAGETILLNLLPDIDLEAELTAARQEHPKKHLKSILSQRLPKRLLAARLSDQQLDTPLHEMSNKMITLICAELQQWAIKPNGTEGYRRAEVTIGGVDCDAISSKTMESQKVPGLYFIGEVLDVTGWLGGYNFQWAWSSGWCAGQYA